MLTKLDPHPFLKNIAATLNETEWWGIPGITNLLIRQQPTWVVFGTEEFESVILKSC